MGKPKVLFGTQVLLAEDNPVNQKVARSMLEILGCRVKVASNGREAVEAFSKGNFDVIFMDCQMPELDGYQVTEIIRKKEMEEWKDGIEQNWGIRRTPIVALTAHAMQGDRERCLEAGMDDYLSKPFSLHQLQAVLNRWLPSKSPAGLPEDTPRKDDMRERQATRDQTRIQCLDEKDSPSHMPEGAYLDRYSHLELLDQKVLDSLRLPSRSGKPSLLERVIHIYLESSPKLIETLRVAISLGDASQMQKAAHSLKSSSGNLGAAILSEICKELEIAGRAGTTAGGTSLLQDLEAEYERVSKALERELRETREET